MTGTLSANLVTAGGLSVTDQVVDAGGGPHPQASPARLGRPIVIVHAVTLALAFGVWAYWDRNLWFFGDEWDFLTRRGLHGATFSIWTPHNEHWSVLPILLWRAIFSLEHLSTYWAYLVPVLLAHVVVVHLLWRRCLKDGADQWVASALALLFALYGTGAENLAWAFQIGFVGSLMFGLLALQVAEGPTSPGRAAIIKRPLVRDGVVALLALAALMCSDVGVATAVALGVVLLARYGWGRAVRALAVPTAAYMVWFALAGRSGLTSTGDTLKMSVFLNIPTFLATNLETDLGHTVGRPAAGLLLAVAVVSWLLLHAVTLFRAHPAVLGGAVAAVTFWVMAALGRDRISDTMSPSRYCYIGTALLLPTVALMLTALPGWLQSLYRRARALVGGGAVGGGRAVVGRLSVIAGVARAAVLIVVLAATASNVSSGHEFARTRTVFVRGLRDQIVTTAALLQDREEMARTINHYPVWASGFASGYLTPEIIVNLYRDKLLPSPGPALMTSTEVREDESWLDLSASHKPLFKGRFALVARTERAARGGRRPGRQNRSATPPRLSRAEARSEALPWPSGPGTCTFSTPLGTPARRGSVTFALARGAPSGALWISLGAGGGRAHFSLADTWGFGGRPGDGRIRGEMFPVPAGRGLWLSDSVPGDRVVLTLGSGQRAELCGLASVAPPPHA